MPFIFSTLRRTAVMLLAAATAVAGLQLTAAVTVAPAAHAVSDPLVVPLQVNSDLPGNFVFTLTGFTEETVTVTPGESTMLRLQKPIESGDTVTIQVSEHPENLRPLNVRYYLMQPNGVPVRQNKSLINGAIYTVKDVFGLDAPVEFGFVPALADLERSHIDIAESEIPADNATPAHVTVTLLGANSGRPVSPQNLTLTAHAEAGTATISEVVDQGDGTYTAMLTSDTPGAVTVSGSVANENSTSWPEQSAMRHRELSSTATVQVDPVTAKAGASEWSITPEAEQQVGEVFIATAQIRDGRGGVVTATTPVVFELAAGLNETLSQTEVTVMTDEHGQAALPLTSHTPGTYAVTALVGGEQIGETQQITLVAANADLEKSELSVSAHEMNVAAHIADTVTVTVALRDRFGNPTESDAETLQLLTSHGTLSEKQPAQNSSGVYTATLSADPSEAGQTAQVSFALRGIPATKTADVRFTATALPAAPVVTSNIAGVLHGTATPGTTVEARSEGALVCTVLVGADGAFRCPAGIVGGAVALPAGTYQLTARDIDGYISSATEVIVLPAPEVRSTHAGNVRGTAEPHTGVQVSTLTGEPVCVTQSSDRGDWECFGLGAGQYLAEQQRDGARSWVTVLSVTPAPTITEILGDEIFGTGIPGATVAMTLSAERAETCRTLVNAAGEWRCVASVDGVYDIVQIGEDGNASVAVPVTIETTRPDAPTLDPTNGDAVTGLTSAGFGVVVSNDSNQQLCETVADDAGRFSCTLSPAAAMGQLLSVVVVDARDAASVPAWVRVGGAHVTLSATEVTVGETLHIVVDGLLPDETVSAEVRSEVVPLGTAQADRSGSAQFTFAVPAGFAVGAHQVHVHGLRSGHLAAGFAVSESKPAPEPSPGGTDVNEPSEAAGSQLPSTHTEHAPQRNLSQTGMEPLSSVLWGGLVLMLGACGVWLMRWRARDRKRDDTDANMKIDSVR